MGWGHAGLVPAEGVPALQNHLHLSRRQGPQPHGYQHSGHPPHLSVQEGLALKLQAPEPQPPRLGAGCARGWWPGCQLTGRH